MEIINQASEVKELKDNQRVGDIKLNNSKITFRGKGNILWCDNNINLLNSNITFNGDNALIILSKNIHSYIVNISVNNDCLVFFGNDTYINGRLNIVVSEQSNVIIGNECLISFECWIRTADPHIIYDTETRNRINPSKSIFIGDHVWIGQHSFILKGSQVGSGSIIGGMSVVAGKKIESNCSYAGNPAKKIREGVFFTGDCVHTYREKETQQHQVYNDDKYIYSYEAQDIIPFSNLETHLNQLTLAQEKLNYLLEILCNTQNKNRFFIESVCDKVEVKDTDNQYLKRLKQLFSK